MPFGLFKNPEVFNGYGLKRHDYKKPHVSVGFTNKVYLSSVFPYDGACWFIHSLKNFPFHLELCCGYINAKEQKSGFYFQGSRKEPYTRFKYLFLKRFFIGAKSPKWLIKRQEKLAELSNQWAAEAYEKYIDSVPGMREELERQYQEDK